MGLFDKVKSFAGSAKARRGTSRQGRDVAASVDAASGGIDKAHRWQSTTRSRVVSNKVEGAVDRDAVPARQRRAETPTETPADDKPSGS